MILMCEICHCLVTAGGSRSPGCLLSLCWQIVMGKEGALIIAGQRWGLGLPTRPCWYYLDWESGPPWYCYPPLFHWYCKVLLPLICGVSADSSGVWYHPVASGGSSLLPKHEGGVPLYFCGLHWYREGVSSWVLTSESPACSASLIPHQRGEEGAPCDCRGGWNPGSVWNCQLLTWPSLRPPWVGGLGCTITA